MRYLNIFSFKAVQFLVIIFLFSSLIVVAQEHPEHPKDKKEAHQLTIEEFADAVDAYVARETKMNEGYFLVKDKKQNTILQMELIKIHKDKLAALGDSTYFVCADFKGTDGNTYDIDIFMEGTSEDDLKPTEKIVHKVNGEPRYTWYEEDGIWKRKEL